MSDQNLEMQISQYADGSLPAPARANLETCLHREPHLRDLLNDYRQLDASVARLAPPVAVEWDSLANKVSSAVASATMLSADEASTDAVAGRIDGTLARTAWMRSGLAASVLLTLCSGALLWRQHQNVQVIPSTIDYSNVATNDVTAPTLGQAPGTVVVQVNVGPGTEPAHPPVQTAEGPTPKAVLAGGNMPTPKPSEKVH